MKTMATKYIHLFDSRRLQRPKLGFAEPATTLLMYEDMNPFQSDHSRMKAIHRLYYACDRGYLVPGRPMQQHRQRHEQRNIALVKKHFDPGI
jgi:hypothetical protein